MVKKNLSIALSVIMLLVFVACSGKTSDDDVEVVVDEGGDSLVVWCWDPAFNIYAMEEAEKIYQQENPGFSLDIREVPWDDIQTQLITIAASDNLSILPDIFLCQNNAFQKNVINYPNLFTDLTNSDIPFDEFGEAVIAYSTIDGKNYGVPFDNGAAVLALRTDILAEAGFTTADFTDITWSEYIEKGKIVKEKTGKPLTSFQAGSGDMILMMLQSAGASMFDDEGKPTFVGNTVMMEALETYKELVDTGVLVEVNSWDEYIGSFINGTVVGTMNGCWILGSVQTADDQAGNWAVVNIPMLDGIDEATNYTANGGSSWAIAASSKNKNLAIDFLKSTFAGSVEFYENILQQSGALSNWAPAAESDKYGEELEFFGGQQIYADIVNFSTQVPSNNTGVYYYEGAEALSIAVTNMIVNNDSVEDVIQAAQDEIEFNMN